jgi:hypothetical protein
MCQISQNNKNEEHVGPGFSQDSPPSVLTKLVCLVTTVATPASLSSAEADGPITLWYQRGGTPEQQRILQKDLVEPFNATHPAPPIAAR